MASGALRLGRCEMTTFAPRSFSSAMIQLASNALSAQATELRTLDQGCHADRVIALARHEDEPDEIAQRVRKCQDFGRQAASRLANGLALSPPFAPCPWR